MSRPPGSPDSPVVTTSEELLARLPSGIELCYQTFGDPGADPLLLVMGLGGPMTWWDADLCRELAAAGFHVIRYDNRDTGRSTKVDGRVRRSDLVRAFAGRPTQPPYRIDDLADDAFGLLDHLGIERAHVAGVSMGGMIAQTMTLARPERVLSLTSISSSTGRRTTGYQHPSLAPTLLASRGGREEYVRASAKVWRIIGSPRFPQDQEEFRARAEETFDRGICRPGVLRQMMAVLTQTDRTAALARVTVPTIVLHGLADKMVHVSGGRATAAAVPGARSIFVPGWGHDLPRELWSTYVRAIRTTADRATH